MHKFSPSYCIITITIVLTTIAMASPTNTLGRQATKRAAKSTKIKRPFCTRGSVRNYGRHAHFFNASNKSKEFSSPPFCCLLRRALARWYGRCVAVFVSNCILISPQSSILVAGLADSPSESWYRNSRVLVRCFVHTVSV